MILSKSSQLRKCGLIPGILAILACLLAGAPACAQGSSLFTAAYNGDLPRVQTLLAQGADVNAKDNLGWTALIYASREATLTW